MPNSPLDNLLPLLQRLDIRLEYALAAAEIAYGKSAATDSYRGLHVNSEDIHRSLSHPPGVPLFHPNAEINLPSDFIPADSRLAQLQQQFELSEFDVDIIAIALAPELDLRYHRIYAYLQDDIRCKLPSVDLALNLLCPHAADKLAKRIHFAPDAPLIRHNLLHLVSDSTSAKSTLLAREFYLDNQIVRFLLAQPGIDERLASYCQLIYPTISPINLSLTTELKQGFKTLLSQKSQKNKSLNFYFQGTDIPGKLETAVSLAGEIQVPLITVNLSLIIENKHNFRSTLQLILREAWFQKAVLYLDGLDSLYGEEQVIYYQYLIEAIAPEFGKKLDYTLAPSLFKGGWGGENYGDKQISLPKQDTPPLNKGGWGGENYGDKQVSLPKKDIPHKPTIIILSGIQPWIPSTTTVMGIIAISFPHPNFAQRRESWQTYLTESNIALDNTNLDILTDRFRITSHQIANAVKDAENTIMWEISKGLTNELTKTTIDALFAAARAQSGHHLASLTQKIEPTYSWDDIILSPDAKTQLREICDRAKYRHLVQEEWGFDDKLSLGKGINVLFSGQPGTGKTMAAEVIANELQLDLYKIDLSQIVSKYIGETEKNLNRIFTAATNANAILLFDEADALFGKRSEVKDAHDRYANIETGYLLQKMEEYDGIAILTTNFRNNIDDAFERRLAVIIEFPFPNQKQRRQIWQQILPDSIPCSSDLDLDFLARHFEITGANIRNIALAAAYLAAADGRQLQMIHLIRALRREYQKMGKILREEEFGKYAGVR